KLVEISGRKDLRAQHRARLVGRHAHPEADDIRADSAREIRRRSRCEAPSQKRHEQDAKRSFGTFHRCPPSSSPPYHIAISRRHPLFVLTNVACPLPSLFASAGKVVWSSSPRCRSRTQSSSLT